MYLVLIFLPLIGSLVSSLFTNFISKKGASFITIFCMILTSLLSFSVFYEIILCNSICSIKLFT